MSDSPSIGVFDSGLGGLTVVKRLLERLPQENIVYVGDVIHVPYGEKSPEQIRSFALGICDFLVRQNAKLIVMACNMSSATALQAARGLFPETPAIGVIDAGVRAALRHSRGGSIGILATTGTVKTGAYTRAVRELFPDAQVCEQACPRFVPLVEAGEWDTPKVAEAVREYTEPLLSAGCRTIILGCTHYPFLAGAIRQVVGPDVTLIDPSEETAIQAANILHEAGMSTPPHVEPVRAYFTTHGADRFAEQGGRFLGIEICGVRSLEWGIDLIAPCIDT